MLDKQMKGNTVSPAEFTEGYQTIIQAINNGLDLKDILLELIKHVEKGFKGTYITFLFYDSRMKAFTDGVSQSLPDTFTRQFYDIPIQGEIGSCGTAVYNGEMVITSNINKDKRWKNIRSMALDYGLQSCWSIPIYTPDHDMIIGSFAFYAKEMRSPTMKEVKTIEAYQEIIGFLISYFNKGERGIEHKRWVTEINRALEQDEIDVHYQPLVQKGFYQPVGVEALVRWNHPEKGLVSPGEFIPHIEQTDLIRLLGERVLYKACKEMSTIINYVGTGFQLSVNLSANQLLQPDLVQRIKETLEDTQFPPHLLSFELTESTLVENTESGAITLNQLKELGVQVALDDFGTAYSSINYLKELPIDILKLDRSFTNDLFNNETNQRIAGTIIQLGHDLELKVLAEGVETYDQLKFLENEGCDYFQGYLFSHPLPVDQLKGYLLKALSPHEPFPATLREVRGI